MPVILSPGNTPPHWQTSTDSDESTIYTQHQSMQAEEKAFHLDHVPASKAKSSQAVSWYKCLECCPS